MADKSKIIKDGHIRLLNPIDQWAYLIGLLPNGINHLSLKAKIHLRMGFLIIMISFIYYFFIWNLLLNLILNHGFFNTSNLKNMIFGFVFSIFLSLLGLIFDIKIFTQYIPKISERQDLLNKIYMRLPIVCILLELTRPIYLIKVILIFLFVYCSNPIISLAFFDVPIEKRARYEQGLQHASNMFATMIHQKECMLICKSDQKNLKNTSNLDCSCSDHLDKQNINDIEIIYKKFMMSILTNVDLKMDSVYQMDHMTLKKILNDITLKKEAQIKIQAALKLDLFEFHFKAIDFFEKNRILNDLIKGKPPKWPNSLDSLQVQAFEEKLNIKKAPSEIQQKKLKEEGDFFSTLYLSIYLVGFLIPMMTLAYKMTLNEEELNDYYAIQSQNKNQSQNHQGEHDK